ncbi:hypothetical protein B0H10DRAFT_2440555 [Mycena sp. CBHHK59/15]|nr:hypothetical protein B0H10DRAFT_2440555 [Mycena sp. CBHHK59/15]
MEINKGLEKIGKTRFGTLYWAAYALLRNLVAIHQLVVTGVVRTDANEKGGSKLAWMKNLRTFSDFQIQLQQLCCILEPIARAIKCLEGLQATVGDVWKFYVAINAVLDDLFRENSLGIPARIQEQVRELVNRRYDEMIGGPSGELYLSGFYLDPEHVRSPILLKQAANQLETPAPRTTSAAISSQSTLTDKDLRDSMPTYRKVGKFLLKFLATELQSGRQVPQFTRYQSADDVMDAFRAQFEAFTRQYPPFSARSASWTKPYLYWTAMLKQADAGVLSFLAIKVFSILPNSMPEERTVSRFTRLNSNDRANQNAATIIAMTKIYQHNRREERASSEESVSNPPSLNWRSVKTLMAAPEKIAADAPGPFNASDQPPVAQVSDDCEAGLAAVNEIDNSSESGSPLGSLAFDIERDGVDITIPFFRDCLSDEPVPGADEIRSLSTWVGTSGKTASRAKPAARLKFGGEVEELDF